MQEKRQHHRRPSRQGGQRKPRPRTTYDRKELKLPEVSAENLAAGARNFAALGLGVDAATAAARMGYTDPTKIQEHAIPVISSGKDVIGLARTGSGKTAAFLLPFVHLEGRPGSPAVLILVPTRELAIQVEEQAVLLGLGLQRNVVAIFGGVDIDQQSSRLQERTDIVVATPGRLVDMLERGRLVLEDVRALILDEGDRMLDLGFADQLEEVLKRLPPVHQTMLFSATMPASLERIAQRHLREPQRIDVNPKEIAAETITQEIYEVTLGEKMPRMLTSIREALERKRSVLVFCSTKVAVDMVERRLQHEEIAAARLHSGLSQERRMKTLNRFRDGTLQVLVATDVAARGLDIPEIGLVINYDMPTDVQDYIHRIGRTGRYDRQGKAISFVVPAERYLISAINMALKKGRLETKVIPRSRSYRPGRRR